MASNDDNAETAEQAHAAHALSRLRVVIVPPAGGVKEAHLIAGPFTEHQLDGLLPHIEIAVREANRPPEGHAGPWPGRFGAPQVIELVNSAQLVTRIGNAGDEWRRG